MLKLSAEETQRRSLLGCRMRSARLAAGFQTIKTFIKVHFDNEVSVAALAQWEAGRRLPDDEILTKISERCQVNAHWLKTGEGDMLAGMTMTEDEAIRKKAIAGAELLIKSLSFQQSEQEPSMLEKMLAQYTEDHQVSMPDETIDDELFSMILADVEEAFKQRDLKIDARKLTDLSIKFYNQIVETVKDKAIRKKTVKLLIKTNGWLFDASFCGTSLKSM